MHYGLESLEGRQLLSTATLDFNGGAGGVFDTGFSGVMTNAKGNGLETPKLSLTNGQLRVTTSTGDMAGTMNNQSNALDLPVDGTLGFTVQTRLAGLPFAQDYQAGGIFIGLDEDNYIKLVAAHNGKQAIQFASEVNGAFSTVAQPNVSFSGVSTLDLRLVGNVSTHTLTAQYRLNSDSDSAWVTVGQVAYTAAVASSSKAGIISTSYGSNKTVQIPFESFSLTTADTTGTVIAGAPVDATKTGGNEMESQVAINPTNPNNLVIVAQNDVNNGPSINISRSMDGGKTWKLASLGASQDGFPAGFQRPDARVLFDGFGNLYVVYMVADTNYAVHLVALRSTDGGATFKSLGSVVGGSDGINPDDPALATGVNPSDSTKRMIWISFTDYTTGRIRVVSGSSTGLGKFGGWSAAKTVSDSFGVYANVAVGVNGEVAVTWQTDDSGQGPNEVMLDVDATGTGNHFGVDKDVLTTNVGGWDFIPAQPDRSIDAEVKVAFDTSNDATRGRLFLAYTGETVDESNDTDIFLTYSDDLGADFVSPIRVNNDASHNSQFLPTLAVDPTSGNVALTWYDARNSADNTGTQLFAAVSFTHGASFDSNIQVSTGMSNQAYANPSPNDLDYGDNGGSAFYGGKLVAVWSDNTNSTGDNPDGSQSKFDVLTDTLSVI